MIFQFSNSYPPKLIDCLNRFYMNPGAPEVEIRRSNQLELAQKQKPVLFLYDYSKKGVSVITRKHLEAGLKIFVLKLKPGYTFFGISLTVLVAWNNILKKIEEDEGPFIYSFQYKSSRLRKIKTLKSKR